MWLMPWKDIRSNVEQDRDTKHMQKESDPFVLFNNKHIFWFVLLSCPL